MKKVTSFFSLFLFLSFYTAAYSQFIINSSYNPKIGDTSIVRYADTTNIVPGESGINKTWNYSNLILTGSPSYEYFLNSSSTPYFGQFPNSNIASLHVQESSSMYHYHQISDTGYIHLGYAMTGYIMSYLIPYPRLTYPVYYGSHYTCNYYGISTSGGMIQHSWGIKSETCDGYGTIILPSGTYNNVLRMKNVEEIFDTTWIGGVVTNTAHYVYTSYNWYRMGYKFLVFGILFANSGTDSAKYVYCETNNQPVGVNKKSATIPERYFLFQNYPNPFNPSTIIKFQIKESGLVTLKAYDILGKDIIVLVNEKLPAGEYEIPFSINQLSNTQLTSGVYFYRIETENYTDSKKMILLK